MATKKTTKTAEQAPAKAPKTKAPAKKATTAKAPKAAAPRHPRAKLAAAHESKAKLAEALAPALARAGEDAATLAAKLKTASNSQLLRLQKAVSTLKDKYGSRDQLIAAIGTAQKKSKDKDYLAKLATLPLPHLLDLARSAKQA